MKIHTRRISPKDLASLFSIFDQSLREDFPEYQPKAAYIYRTVNFNKTFFERFLKNRKNLVIGAYAGKTLIGFSNVLGQSGGVGEIEWLIVGPPFRSQGAGTAILAAIEKWAFRTKRHYLYLHTESRGNMEFYRKRGWRYVGVQKTAWMGVDEHLMEKNLRQRPYKETFEAYEKMGV